MLMAARCLWGGQTWIVFFRCRVANGEHRGARSGIGCWVAAAMGRLCHYHTISILRCIVKLTKAATWSLLSALFSIIGTKLSSVGGCSLISCRVVIASSQYRWNAGHSNWVCQAGLLFIFLQDVIFFQKYKYLKQNICFSHESLIHFSRKQPVALVTCGGTIEIC